MSLLLYGNAAVMVSAARTLLLLRCEQYGSMAIRAQKQPLTTPACTNDASIHGRGSGASTTRNS